MRRYTSRPATVSSLQCSWPSTSVTFWWHRCGGGCCRTLVTVWRGLDRHLVTTRCGTSVTLHCTFYTAVSDLADFIVRILEKFSLASSSTHKKINFDTLSTLEVARTVSRIFSYPTSRCTNINILLHLLYPLYMCVHIYTHTQIKYACIHIFFNHCEQDVPLPLNI